MDEMNTLLKRLNDLQDVIEEEGEEEQQFSLSLSSFVATLEKRRLEVLDANANASQKSHLMESAADHKANGTKAFSAQNYEEAKTFF